MKDMLISHKYAIHLATSKPTKKELKRKRKKKRACMWR